ncbi:MULTISPECIES: DUF6355 family natural product biosynthesis protein [Streptosporangium]|uniref:DUF6355 family natural product biosynthesis protein n=1 Tax=Streptosporangium jomthongense TaxID=1193683 RepID=A0ABV8F7D3_9ACTN
MLTRILKTVGGTLAALALTTAPVYANAITTAGDPGGARALVECGYDEVGGSAYYTHCNSDVNVLIRVERHWDLPGYDQCVRPGSTFLGLTYEIKFAWYKGVLC